MDSSSFRGDRDAEAKRLPMKALFRGDYSERTGDARDKGGPGLIVRSHCGVSPAAKSEHGGGGMWRRGTDYRCPVKEAPRCSTYGGSFLSECLPDKSMAGGEGQNVP